MTPLWLALLDADPGADVAVPLRDVGAGAEEGLLCLWRQFERPHKDALQADPRIHDPNGPGCVMSLALPPNDARPIADDPAIVQARRDVLADGRPCAVSLLTADPVTIAGALTLARADRPGEVAALRDDPFARLWPTRQLWVTPGVFGALVRPTGPSLERYSGRPWPYDRF